ncbi:hypothetical protein UlMin_006842 [Ulmus minor]
MSLESFLVPPPQNQPPPNINSINDDPIPILDFQCLSHSQDNEKFEEVCKEWGVFRLVNHGIPETLLSQLQDSLNKILSFSFESKFYLFNNPSSFNWGFGFHSECLFVPVTQLSQIQAEDHILASFRNMMDEYANHMFRVASTLNEAIAKNLNIETIESKSNVFEPTGFFRMYRYSPYPFPDDVFGLDAHINNSTLAIINENHAGGLQLLKDEEWFTLKPIPNTLIVNLGDMMKVISKDKYHNIKYRVMVSKDKERISVCYSVQKKEV